MNQYLEANLTFVTDDATAALAAWETLNRVAAGIAFEGIRVELSLDRVTDLDDEDDDTQAETSDDDTPAT